MKVEKITVDWLEKFGACEEGIKFFRRNKLEGFPVSLVDQIKGDYTGFVSWIGKIIDLESNIKYDDKWNLIEKKDFWTNEYRFDITRNLVWNKDRLGNEFRYDERGNKIFEKDRYGKEYKWEYRYDENGNVIRMVDRYGNRWQYRYDNVGNVIWSKIKGGSEHNYQIEYYSDGQLKRYRNLYIPWFEKK